MKKKGKNTGKKIFWITAVLCIGFVAFFVGIIFKMPLDSKTLEVRFIIDENIGFDVNKTALTFGKIPPGGTSTRNMIIGNEYDFPVEVRVFASKEIVSYLSVDFESIFLGARETKKVPITLIVPVNASFGEYAGEIVFNTYRR